MPCKEKKSNRGSSTLTIFSQASRISGVRKLTRKPGKFAAKIWYSLVSQKTIAITLAEKFYGFQTTRETKISLILFKSVLDTTIKSATVIIQ